jgi:hypothetical protein
MTTQVFGDVHPRKRHASFVRPTPVDFVVICLQCGGEAVARDVDPNRATRASLHHNTGFKTDSTLPHEPAPPDAPWANSPGAPPSARRATPAIPPGFSWESWMADNVQLKD